MSAPRSMDALFRPAPRATGERVLLVMLPGAGMVPRDFVEQGFVEAVHERGLPVDIVAAGPDLDCYLDGTAAEAIEREIVRPLQRPHHARLWFLGISLGGMGALLHARAHAERVEGVLLLAPFLGTPGLIAEVAGAGGLSAWEPGEIAPNDSERLLLGWLKAYPTAPPPRPKLLLGYGREDRFVRGHALLAGHLAERDVLLTEGGHDWATWMRLWQRLLDRAPFAHPAADGVF